MSLTSLNTVDGDSASAPEIYTAWTNSNALTMRTEAGIFHTVVGEGKRWNNVSPAWLPDGTQIAFLTNRSDRWQVRAMNADGFNPRSMVAEECDSPGGTTTRMKIVISNQFSSIQSFTDYR